MACCLCDSNPELDESKNYQASYFLVFCFQKTHSIVLMASADAHYCFTIVDVGAYGRNSDGGVLKNSNFGIAMEKGLLKVPGPKLLPGSNVVAPHVFIGDEAFQLRDDFMRPYPGQNLENAKDNFNQRLSRARYTSDAF